MTALSRCTRASKACDTKGLGEHCSVLVEDICLCHKRGPACRTSARSMAWCRTPRCPHFPTPPMRRHTLAHRAHSHPRSSPLGPMEERAEQVCRRGWSDKHATCSHRPGPCSNDLLLHLQVRMQVHARHLEELAATPKVPRHHSRDPQHTVPAHPPAANLRPPARTRPVQLKPAETCLCCTVAQPATTPCSPPSLTPLSAPRRSAVHVVVR
jgi:hypothetical protein